MAGVALWESLCADFVVGAALHEPLCADFVAGAALCEPPRVDFVAGTALCPPQCADVVAGAIQNALRRDSERSKCCIFQWNRWLRSWQVKVSETTGAKRSRIILGHGRNRPAIGIRGFTCVLKCRFRGRHSTFVNLHVQICWKAQHFVNLHVQISLQHFVNLHVQISWQVQYFVNLHV